jgi:hypothetical protein
MRANGAELVGEVAQYASVITSNPAICDHFKSGQRSRIQDMKLFYRAAAG